MSARSVTKVRGQCTGFYVVCLQALQVTERFADVISYDRPWSMNLTEHRLLRGMFASTD